MQAALEPAGSPHGSFYDSERRLRMRTTYYRRYRMEVDLREVRLPAPTLPKGYFWRTWTPDLLDRHTVVKYESFRQEIDSRVFPCLGEIPGCQRLMTEITRQKAFLPQATWLITYQPTRNDDPSDCGTIQGLAHSATYGAVQNVGVVPEHRGQGLGRALVVKALYGFRAAGLQRVYLEVTAQNEPAVELYRSIGFRLTRTMYRAVEEEPVSSW